MRERERKVNTPGGGEFGINVWAHGSRVLSRNQFAESRKIKG